MSVTAENASATQVILGTTVTARRTSAHARPGMAASAATVGTASVGSASAQSQGPLGKHVRSAQPALMPAAPRGKAPTPVSPPDHPAIWPVSLQGHQPLTPHLPHLAHTDLQGSETLTHMNSNRAFEALVPWRFCKNKTKAKQNNKKQDCYSSLEITGLLG